MNGRILPPCVGVFLSQYIQLKYKIYSGHSNGMIINMMFPNIKITGNVIISAVAAVCTLLCSGTLSGFTQRTISDLMFEYLPRVPMLICGRKLSGGF
jgi:hypothetical protein